MYDVTGASSGFLLYMGLNLATIFLYLMLAVSVYAESTVASFVFACCCLSTSSRTRGGMKERDLINFSSSFCVSRSAICSCLIFQAR